MKYENISSLLKRPAISSGFKNMGFTHYEILNGKNFSFNNSYYDSSIQHDCGYKLNLISSQNGVFRTNCIDCLDRTNVIQTVISRIILHNILNTIDISDTAAEFKEPFEPFKPYFEDTFRLMWTENGNFVSQAYSGSNALKADYTRTGKRTKAGAIEDGRNTMIRFYYNNFRDGHNQDSHDYFIGKINPSKQEIKDHSVFAPFILLAFVFFIATILYSSASSISLPLNYELSLKKMIFKFILFASILVLSMRISLKFFKQSIIDRPTNDQ